MNTVFFTECGVNRMFFRYNGPSPSPSPPEAKTLTRQQHKSMVIAHNAATLNHRISTSSRSTNSPFSPWVCLPCKGSRLPPSWESLDKTQPAATRHRSQDRLQVKLTANNKRIGKNWSSQYMIICTTVWWAKQTLLTQAKQQTQHKSKHYLQLPLTSVYLLLLKNKTYLFFKIRASFPSTTF